MSVDLCVQHEQQRQLTRTGPDPRVRRAHALLLLTQDHSVAAVARLFAMAPHRVRAWRARFLASGRHGLADEPRTGRPPKLDATARAFLEEVLETATTHLLADLQARFHQPDPGGIALIHNFCEAA